jgi:transposase-like protein
MPASTVSFSRTCPHCRGYRVATRRKYKTRVFCTKCGRAWTYQLYGKTGREVFNGQHLEKNHGYACVAEKFEPDGSASNQIVFW